jgi:hypothetical protein
MIKHDFDHILSSRCETMRAVLAGKADEYATGGDRLHNFKAAAGFDAAEISPEQALWGMLRKHLVSLADIVAATAPGIDSCPSQWLRNEKIGDAINYLVLLEALLIDRERSAL